MVKRYASYLEPRLWLDLESVPGALEERLSRLTGMALTATRLEREFGLRLGSFEIKPGNPPRAGSQGVGTLWHPRELAPQ